MEVVTTNVRGLGNPQKRKTLFQWLETKSFDIVCLQETFCTNENVNQIMNEWKGTSFHSTSTSPHSKGVSILFKHNFGYDLIDCHTCEDGRIFLINLKHNANTYTVANIYAPTEMNYRKDFFSNCRKWISNKTLNANCLLICGDLNCSLSNIDRKVQNIDRSRASFKDFLTYLDVRDNFRELNKSKISYTYSNNKSDIQSRIDYILTSSYMLNLAKKCYILTAPRIPDHKAVICSFRDDIDSGKGYWKLNTKLLENPEYTEHIQKTIQNTVDEVSIYVNKRQLWDFCKVRIKEESIKWSITRSKNLKNEKNEIEKELIAIEDQISNSSDNKILQQLNCQKENLRSRQNEMYTIEAEGAYIRARARWVEEGEKNTKYFLNLEKRRQTNNRISCVRDEKGNNYYKSKDILHEGAKFYKRLYSKQDIAITDIDEYLKGINLYNILSDIDANQCEGKISEGECSNII